MPRCGRSIEWLSAADGLVRRVRPDPGRKNNIRDGTAASRSTSSFEPRITGIHWCRLAGWMSRMRWRPVEAAPPACSTMKAMGLASYMSRSFPSSPLVCILAS